MAQLKESFIIDAIFFSPPIEVLEVQTVSDKSVSEVEVHVYNRGYTTSEVAVRIGNCSGRMRTNEKHQAIVDPHESAALLFTLRQSKAGVESLKPTPSLCTGTVYSMCLSHNAE